MSELDDLYDLRDDLDRLAQRFEVASKTDRTSYEASDDAGAVTVRVDTTGAIADVRVAMDWRERINDDAALAPAVLAAASRAGLARIEEWGQRANEVMTGPAPQLRPAPGLYDTLAGELEARVRPGRTPEEVAVTERAMAEVFQELIDSVDELTGQMHALAGSETAGASDVERNVVARLDATGALVGLELRLAWLARAHPNNIGRLVTAAIQEARSALRGGGLSGLLPGSRLQDLTDLLNDADAISARLGL